MYGSLHLSTRIIQNAKSLYKGLDAKVPYDRLDFSIYC